MSQKQILIIGAGLLGCFAARALAAYDVHVTVLEQREDVCTGITRANTGIVYAGYDNRPDTLKSRLCVHANAGFEELCAQLDVPFSRCGSLMVAFGPRGEKVLRKKLEQGLQNHVPNLELLERTDVLEMEPHLAPSVVSGLYAPTTGTVEPWALGIAAYENAAANGAEFCLNTRLIHLKKDRHSFVAETDRGTYRADAVLNCAGLASDRVRELYAVPSVRIFPSAADYFVLDDSARGFLNHVIFHEPEIKGKGLTLVPTVTGNLLVGPTERDADGSVGSVAPSGLEELFQLCREIVPELPLSQIIRSFGAVRPNPDRVQLIGAVWQPAHIKNSDFFILEDDGLYSLVGIKTPGLTCAHALGTYMAERITAQLSASVRRPDYDPTRRGIPCSREMTTDQRAAHITQDPTFGRIICRCKSVTEGEVREAIRRGAVTLDGVKRRTGAGMGRCQGGFCTQRILEILAAETGRAPVAITKDGSDSYILAGDEYGNC